MNEIALTKAARNSFEWILNYRRDFHGMLERYRCCLEETMEQTERIIRSITDMEEELDYFIEELKKGEQDEA